MDYDRFFNELGRSRKPSPLRVLYTVGCAASQTLSMPLIALSGGLPCSESFPVKTISFDLKDGETVTLDEKTTAQCLQYGESTGVNALMGWLEKILVTYHKPKLLHPSSLSPSDGNRTTIVLTNGCQEAMSKLFGALVSKGDTVLIEESVYSGCLSLLRPYGAKLQTVKSTLGGMDVEDLERVLSKWSPKDIKDKTSDIAKLMYIIPTGGNPTGQNLSLESKTKIYCLAQKYDFLIMEDDPYYFHNFEEGDPYYFHNFEEVQNLPCSPLSFSGGGPLYYFHNFEETAPPSFLSLDTDGRVLRLDSFSKIISPGMRLGFASGPKAIMNVLLYDIQTSGVHGNHLAQMMVLGLMEKWGMEGFHRHVEKACKLYRNRRDMCIRAVERHLKGLAEWTVPSGGFFLWLKLKDVKDSQRLILDRAIQKGVLCAPGCGFEAVKGTMSSFIRISYSHVTEEDMNTALSRLAEAIREEVDKNWQH